MRILAASWLVIGLAFFAARNWISILVFGELEYTLAEMAALALVPPIQALALTWAMRGFVPRPRQAAGRPLLGRRSVQAVWAMEIAVLSLFSAAAAGLIDLPFPEHRVVELAIGLVLLCAAGLVFLAARRQTESATARRMVLLGAVSAVLGAFAVVSAFGFQWWVIQRIAPLTAVAFIVTGLVLVPLLLWAARVVGMTAGRPLEVAAVLAAAVVSATPICFYLRPYLGPNWLAPMLLCFSLAATCALTAAITSLEPREAPAIAASPTDRPASLRTGLAVWMVLLVSSAAVWVGGASVFSAGWNPSPRALLEVVLVSAGQAVAMLLWIVVPVAARDGRLSTLLPPRRWIFLTLVIEGVALLLFWWRWPAGDGAYWTWLLVWSGLKGVVLGIMLVTAAVRGARRTAWGIAPGLGVVAVAAVGLTTWHSVVWIGLIALMVPAFAPEWRQARLLVLAVMTPAVLIAVPSLALQIRPLEPAVAIVISVGVVATSLLFGWLPPLRGGARTNRAEVVGS